MPVPPPKPTTEGPRDRQVTREVRKLVRALQALGPLDEDRLARAVGAAYWDADHFESALAYAVADGEIVRDADGRLTSV